MRNFDLPEPIRAPESEEMRRSRHRLTWIAFCYFFTGYTLLHKLLIPLVLSFTNLHGSPYAAIDFWFLQPLWMSYIVYRRQWGWALALNAGLATMFAVYQLYELFDGQLVGWLAFSKILSSIPMAIVSIIFLRSQPLTKWLRPAVVGAGFTLVWAVAQQTPPVEPPKPSPLRVETPQPPPELNSVSSDSECGRQEVHILPEQHRTITIPSQVEVRNCGFVPSVIVIQEGTLHLINHSNYPVNFHYLESRSNGAARPAWNFMIPPNTQRTSPKIQLNPDQAGLIYSDAQTLAGIVAIVPPTRKLPWQFKRRPLAIESIAP